MIFGFYSDDYKLKTDIIAEAINEKCIIQYTEVYKKQIYDKVPYLSYAPICFVSALKNQRIQTLFEQINNVYENYNRKVPTNILNVSSLVGSFISTI